MSQSTGSLGVTRRNTVFCAQDMSCPEMLWQPARALCSNTGVIVKAQNRGQSMKEGFGVIFKGFEVEDGRCSC